jgi:DNA-binding transcriptional LysR family regulator
MVSQFCRDLSQWHGFRCRPDSAFDSASGQSTPRCLRSGSRSTALSTAAPEGQRLYTQVVASIEQLTTISTRSLAVNSPQILHLGTPPEFFADRLLPQLSPAEHWLYRVQFGLATDLIAQLLAGQLDVVIATQRIARSDLEYKLITEENFWLVAPPNTIVPISPEILQADLTSLEAWLRGQPLIAYGEDLPIIRRFWRVVFGRRLDLVPQLVLPDLRAIRQAIADGFGFSVLPDYLCEAMVKSQALKLILKPQNAVANQIWLACRKSDRRSPQVILLLDLLQLP